mmetsp:Transcript_93291/g.301778  ORF Transcript_93291/g.301778 Transcript_93291/m.301778 type:complete len:266 (+) Transcript_93291:823-1620(+)
MMRPQGSEWWTWMQPQAVGPKQVQAPQGGYSSEQGALSRRGDALRSLGARIRLQTLPSPEPGPHSEEKQECAAASIPVDAHRAPLQAADQHASGIEGCNQWECRMPNEHNTGKDLRVVGGCIRQLPGNKRTDGEHQSHQNKQDVALGYPQPRRRLRREPGQLPEDGGDSRQRGADREEADARRLELLRQGGPEDEDGALQRGVLGALRWRGGRRGGRVVGPGAAAQLLGEDGRAQVVHVRGRAVASRTLDGLLRQAVREAFGGPD